MSQEHVTHCLCSDGAEATTEDTEVVSSVIFFWELGHFDEHGFFLFNKK